MNTRDPKKREAFIQGLRQLATYLEERPELPVPPFGETIHVFVSTKEEFQQVARDMGHADKQFNGDWASLNRKFESVEVQYTIERQQVCARKVVGTREVPAHSEDIVEWSCSESILADAKESI